MVKITYNKKARILSLKLRRKKSVDSDVQDNVVIDRDADGNIVNVDIMDVDINEFKRVQAHSKRTRVAVLA